MKITTSKYRVFKAAAIYSPEFLNLTGDERSVFVTLLNTADDDGIVSHLDNFIRRTDIPVSLLEDLEDRNMITLLTWDSYIIHDFNKYVYVETDPDREKWDAEALPLEDQLAGMLQLGFCC